MPAGVWRTGCYWSTPPHSAVYRAAAQVVAVHRFAAARTHVDLLLLGGAKQFTASDDEAQFGGALDEQAGMLQEFGLLFDHAHGAPPSASFEMVASLR